jgi:hypothetical protein
MRFPNSGVDPGKELSLLSAEVLAIEVIQQVVSLFAKGSRQKVNEGYTVFIG